MQNRRPNDTPPMLYFLQIGVQSYPLRIPSSDVRYLEYLPQNHKLYECTKVSINLITHKQHERMGNKKVLFLIAKMPSVLECANV